MNSMEEDFRQMNSDGYDEQYQQCFHGNSKIINDIASEFETPGKLPRTNCNIPMPSVKPPASNGDRICDTCIKADVCVLSSDLHKAVDNIKEISKRTGVFIDIDIRCKKWSGKVSNYRELETR